MDFGLSRKIRGKRTRVQTVPNLTQEFDEMMAQYSTMGGGEGKDIEILVKLFAEECESQDLKDSDLIGAAWVKFLGEHKHQMTVWPMTALVLNILATYWVFGQSLFQGLPELEKMLVRDIVMEISDRQEELSVKNGNSSVD